VSVFDAARALRVPRDRFAPVKTTNELLALRSDCYAIGNDCRVALAPGRDGPPFVDLDPAHYKLVRDFEARFPSGPPSLVECRRLVVRGDVVFGTGVVARGAVELDHSGDGRVRIQDGAVLEG
jgi:UTP--glucose-1-phosphate uridylyltransferase